MTNVEAKISKLLLEACEELLPKTTAANNKKIQQVLKLLREQVDDTKPQKLAEPNHSLKWTQLPI